MALKSTRYRKVEPAALNRRTTPRHEVYVSSASLKRNGNMSIAATLLDISIYGCRFEADAVFKEGEKVTVTVDEHAPFKATLVWQKTKQAGCRFADALDTEILRTLTLAS
ncbi:PilZ domain-containing protein [Parasphingorhabdus cellanae]|uniref:PilZ domain-containing protein n=1 Tax=Parasphingorhabdus cellanae TaxID=2806553 RepID=A0ABX7T4S2_9SPHN|nr:PilZ domain-containing protein [Parasphingorhabdus cellanae]QTD56588.1 PilZ domain-containing protein [Parasphingorhabdus cellanae]